LPFDENFVLPSPDEVVHGKGSLASKIARWMNGGKQQTCGPYAGFMYGHPGKNQLYGQ